MAIVITYIILGSALLFIVLLWIAVGVRHLFVLKRNVKTAWEFADEKIRKRHDVIPLAIEVCKEALSGDPHFKEVYGRLISARDGARRLYFPSGDKTEREYELSFRLKEFFDFVRDHQLLKTRGVFWEIKKEIVDLEHDIENRVEAYNEVVRKFNAARKTTLLAPLAMISRVGTALIFEFEKKA